MWLGAAIGFWALVGLAGIIIRFKETGRQFDRMINHEAMPEAEGDE